MAERIQLRRTKGWRKPEGAIVVARPTRWGNPWVVHTHTLARCGPELALCPEWIAHDRQDAVTKYRHALLYPLWGQPEMPDIDDIRRELAGHDLACWCPLVDADGLPVPCHADVLLRLANGS